jgi:hypothetical protein
VIPTTPVAHGKQELNPDDVDFMDDDLNKDQLFAFD